MLEIKKTIINEMEEVLDDRGYEYSSYALCKIVDSSISAKENLINLFSKHPLWNAEKLMIQFDADMTREINTYAVYQFVKWLRLNVNGQFNYFELNKSRECKICDFINEIEEQFFNEGMKDKIDEVNKLNDNFKLRTNMKASKAIGKICREEGWDKLAEYNQKYAELCDALNPIKVKRHTCISINPIDFLLMSNGNSWHSCHDIGRQGDSGCYSSGTISYMLDEHSFLFYTVDASYDGNKIELEKKINRQVFGYNDEVLAQLRLYPQSNDCGAEVVYDDIRAIVQKVVADCLEKPNMWIKSKNDTNEVIKAGCGATCYPDWRRGNPGADHCSISTLKERVNGKDGRSIVFGAHPICIDCGDTHDVEGSISCCNNGYYEYCHCCGERIYEDEQYYYDGYYYCENCVTYCEDCNEYYPDNMIEYIDGCNVCVHCIDNSGNYYTCNNCGSIHYYEEMTLTEDGNWYCSDCRDEHTFECEKCGEIHDKSDGVYDEHTGRMYCESCYDELIAEREDEEEEVV